MKASVTELPFNRLLGLKQVPDAPGRLRLPAGAHYLNHLGTVHASALLALAEASSGEFLLRHFGSTDGIVPVVRRLESKFRKAAHGAVTATATASADVLAQLEPTLAAKGRAMITVVVELHDDAGTHVLSASVEWFIGAETKVEGRESKA